MLVGLEIIERGTGGLAGVEPLSEHPSLSRSYGTHSLVLWYLSWSTLHPGVPFQTAGSAANPGTGQVVRSTGTPTQGSRNLSAGVRRGTTTYLGFLPSSVRLLLPPAQLFSSSFTPPRTRPPLPSPRSSHHDLDTGAPSPPRRPPRRPAAAFIKLPSIPLTRTRASRLTRTRVSANASCAAHSPPTREQLFCPGHPHLILSSTPFRPKPSPFSPSTLFFDHEPANSGNRPRTHPASRIYGLRTSRPICGVAYTRLSGWTPASHHGSRLPFRRD